jgi:hypothetical protein
MPNNNNGGGGGVVVDNVLPVLTSRFLALPQQQQLFEEDQNQIYQEEAAVAKQKHQQDEQLLQLVNSMTAAAAAQHQIQTEYQTEEEEDEDCFANLPTNLFAEEETQAPLLLLPPPPVSAAVAVNQLMVVSPGNSRTGMLWASDSFNTNSIIHVDPDRRLSCPLPNSCTAMIAVAIAPHPPTTPRRSGGGCGSSELFASFSSSTPTSEVSPSMWQYGAAGASSSPRTTDAVEASAWMQQDNSMAMIPLAPSLTYGGGAVNFNTTGLPPLPQFLPVIDGIPAMIRCYCDYMDDEVSLLADDPEDDDDNVLPNTTYDVLANTGIFAEEGEEDG